MPLSLSSRLGFLPALALATCLLSAVSGLVAPAHAAADLGTLELHTGAVRLERSGDAAWRPIVRCGLSLNVVGPLHLGAFVLLTGSELPLRSAQAGGGLYLAVRPKLPVLRLRPAVEISAGRLRLPLADMSQQPAPDPERVFSASVAASLGVAVAEAVTLEGRVDYTRYYGAASGSALGDDSFTLSAGMTIHIP